MATEYRIAVVSPFLDKRHGTERCVAEQVERLAREYGHEVHLYCQKVEDIGGLEEFDRPHGSRRPSGRGKEAAAPSTAPTPGSIFWHKVSDIPGPHLVKYLWWLLANQFRRWRDQRARGLHYDLVYSPGINCWDANAIAVHIVFHEFFRLVRDELRLRNTPPRAWPRAVHRWLYYHLIMALEKWIYRDPRVTLAAVSGLTAGEIQRFFGRQDVHVIPNAVDLDTFNPSARGTRRAEVRQRLQLGEEDFALLLIGNDWKKKGLSCLLEAVSACLDLPLKLLIVGRDDRTPYVAAIERLGLQDRVRFVEPSADVLQFYAAADAYAGPSLHDSFALPPAEAMACGLPVITSVSNGGSEMIEQGVNGFVLQDPRDRNELAEVIRQLFGHAELRRRLGENAARTAQEYGWNRNAAEIGIIFEQIMTQRGKGNEA